MNCNANCIYCIGGDHHLEEKTSNIICTKFGVPWQYKKIDYETGLGDECEYYVDESEVI